jgi:hypothetical protein
LSEGLAWLLERGVEAIRRRDRELCGLFLKLTEGVAGLSVHGPRDPDRRCGVFSVNVDGMGPMELAGAMEADFGLCTRPGLHCSPLAHETIGTHPAGTCRLSFGHFTTADEVRFLIKQCPWLELLQKSDRRHLAARVAQTICPTEGRVWCAEFGGHYYFEMPLMACSGADHCEMLFRPSTGVGVGRG